MLRKKILSIIILVMAASIPLTSTSTTANAKTTYLPQYIRHHTWYRLTDGTQGGYHDKTTFTGNKMHIHSYFGKKVWKITNLKRSNSKTYYGRLHYSKKNSQPVKFKIINKKHFDIIQKHMWNLKGNYTGNEQFGAQIFKR